MANGPLLPLSPLLDRLLPLLPHSPLVDTPAVLALIVVGAVMSPSPVYSVVNIASVINRSTLVALD